MYSICFGVSYFEESYICIVIIKVWPFMFYASPIFPTSSIIKFQFCQTKNKGISTHAMTRIPPTQVRKAIKTQREGKQAPPRPKLRNKETPDLSPLFSYPREKMKRHGKMKMSSAYMPYLHWPCCRGPFNGLERHNYGIR